MRKQFLIPFCVVIAVLALLLVWLVAHKAHEPNQASEAQTSNANVSSVEKNVQESVGITQTNSTADSATPNKSEDELTLEEKNERIRKLLEAQNKPIELWGKVVDQDDAPLSSVTVKSEIGHFVWPPEQHPNGISTKQEQKSDEDGLFHIRDNSATGIYVILQKDGYEQESIKGNGYALGTGGGSKDNPVILKMWSTNIHEQLITGGNKFHIVPDGRPYVIDLTKGTIAESGDGDLKIWVKRPEQITYGKRYDWSCQIDVLNGGLLAATDSSMFLAPTDGYTSTFKFEQKIGSGWGDTTGEKQFYVLLNSGKEYGRITIELSAYYNNQIPGMVRINYAVNPSGSRILR